MDVRTISDDEVEPWVAAMNEGFLGRPAEGEAEFRRPAMDLDRTLGAFDGDRVVATFRSFPTEVTLPGEVTVPAGAITNVAVAPTHRRRRLLTELMRRDLDAADERGEPVSVLIASEYPIYGRFGFGPATEHATLRIRRHAVRFHHDEPADVELVTPEEARGHIRTVLDAHRRRHPGEIDRNDLRLDLETGIREHPKRKGPAPFQALHREPDGAVTGYLRYRANDDWDGRFPNVELEVEELIGASPAASAALWRYCLGIDWVASVRARDRGPADPLPLLLADARAVEETHRADFLWARILDVPAVLARRGYRHDATLVIEVTDPLGYAQGRYRLAVADGTAVCEPADADPVLRLPVSVLSAVVFGGASLHRFAEAGRVEELVPGALLDAAATFHWPVAPWCATWF